MLEFLLNMSHLEHADNAVPKGVGNLLVHIIDTHVEQLHDTVLHLETHLDDVERSLDTGVGATKKQMLDDRRFPKMHLDLQKLLQVIAHGDQVFPRVKDKCAGKAWCTSEDLAALEVLVARLRKLKENVGFIANRITAIQAGLDSWQAEQINRKLYYLSFLSVIFLPLSIVTGAFGMNVGGVPWTKQTDPTLVHGFRNVLIICAVIVMLLLAGFGVVPLYTYLVTRHKHQAVKAKWLSSKRSVRYRGSLRYPAYLRL
jgi:Mg2+ and Co2+ transporter CorA